MGEKMKQYIKEQPAVWQHILDARKALTADFVAAFRSTDFKRLVLVGSGSSCNASRMAKNFFEAQLGIETAVIEPTRLAPVMKLYGEGAIFIASSQGGGSTSTLATVKEIRAAGYRVAGITTDTTSPIAQSCDTHVLIDIGEEAVGPKSKGMTSTVLTLYMAVMELLLAQGRLDEALYNSTLAALVESFRLAVGNIEACAAWCEGEGKKLAAAPHISLIAEGDDTPVMSEGALKMLETLHVPVAYYEFEEYLHGVNYTINPENWCIQVTDPANDRERMLRLRDFALEHGSHCFVVSTGIPTGIVGELFLQATGNGATRPFETLLPFQMISARLSEEKGINVDVRFFPDYHSKLATKT